MLSWACTTLLLASAPAAEAYTHSMATNSGGQRHLALGGASRNRRGVAASPSPAHKLARRGGGLAPLRYEKDDQSSEEEAERLANLDAQLNAFLGAGMGPGGAALDGGEGGAGAEASFVAARPASKRGGETKSKLALQVRERVVREGGESGVWW